MLTATKPASALPAGVAPYKRTAEFTQATVPAGLLAAHSTKDGVWGLIEVAEGRLLYRVVDPRRRALERAVIQDRPAVIEPTILHEVAPDGPVRFFVTFYR